MSISEEKQEEDYKYINQLFPVGRLPRPSFTPWLTCTQVNQVWDESVIFEGVTKVA